jgi:hypothetical protein
MALTGIAGRVGANGGLGRFFGLPSCVQAPRALGGGHFARALDATVTPSTGVQFANVPLWMTARIRLNSLFRAMKRKARGYRRLAGMTTILYFVAGKLILPCHRLTHFK